MNEYLDFAQRLAKEAGTVMHKYFSIDQQTQIKSDLTPVTIADSTINKLVLDAIHEQYPGHGILAEEESDFRGDEEYVWVCDPLDGTIAYTLTIPVSTFAISLLKDGQPIIAVIYDCFQDRLWHAVKDAGAYCNGVPIHTNEISDLSASVVASSGPTKSKYFDVPKFRYDLQKKVFRLMQLSSSQYESMMVASGKFAAVVFPGNSPHDMAAVRLIIEEAGGRITSLSGEDQRYDQEINGAIVSNGRVHKDLLLMVDATRH